MERKKGSGRLNEKQMRRIKRVAAAGRSHPNARKFYVFLLVSLLLWFYFTAFCKRNKATVAAALCGSVLLALLFGKVILSDDNQLAWQQGKLFDLRDEAYDGMYDSENSTSAEGLQNKESAFIRILMEENKDTVGWLTIPDTEINYPVMQTPEDEDYYLDRGFYGKKNRNGCLLVSAGCDISKDTTNWIIHGHNMKSGAMFADLMKYLKHDFQKEHNLIYLETLDGMRVYEVLSVFQSRVFLEEDRVFKYYQNYDLEKKEDFVYFYNNVKALSLYDTGVTAEFGDHFITLSTCSYHTDNGRFVVVGKQIKD